MIFLRWQRVLIGVLFVYCFLEARPYLTGMIGGANKHHLNQQAQKVASNYVYSQELMQAIEQETDPDRRNILLRELARLKP